MLPETKRKARDEPKRGRENAKKTKKQNNLSSAKTHARKNRREKKTGPRLPDSLQKEIQSLIPSANSDFNSYEDVLSDYNVEDEKLYGNDVYEYEEEQPEEESRKNRRFDPVQVNRSEYEMPDRLSDDFDDENLPSDDDDDDDDVGNDHYNVGSSVSKEAGKYESGEEESDDGRHTRMLQGITGMPSNAFQGKNKKSAVISEAYPESEFNPSRGNGKFSIEDLMEPLRGKSDYQRLNKKIHEIKRNSGTIRPPSSEVEQQKMEMDIAYKISKDEITKWEAIVKRNREAPTVYFDREMDLRPPTLGSIASEFKPRTEFEIQMASLFHDDELLDAHRKDGSRLLEMNEVSVEEEKDRLNRIAKMRNILFRHELKAKHIKKIKSKTYHRLLKKDRQKALPSEFAMDPKAAKEYAEMQDRKRAEERMNLRHKKNKWAVHIKARGLDKQDEGTRAAIAKQLQLHATLTRKMESMRDSSSSSDHSSDEDDIDENLAGHHDGRASALLEKAKEKTERLLTEEAEVPKSGLFNLPFMIRGMEKRKEDANKEGELALQEFDSMKKLDDPTGPGSTEISRPCGRMVFGTDKSQTSRAKASNRLRRNNSHSGSDSDNDIEVREIVEVDSGSNHLETKADSHALSTREDFDVHRNSILKNICDITNHYPETTVDVSILVSDSWKKVKNKEKEVVHRKSRENPHAVDEHIKEDAKEFDDDSETESGVQMVDGVLSSVPDVSYQLPSQEELIRQAFAGDDVEDDFQNDKQEILNEEVPEPEKPVLLPGWGQWTHIQQKKGLPSWMLKEHENAKKRRQEALNRRKDAALKHVIISERVDKKTEKLHVKGVPYPFPSKEAFNYSLSQPIGPDFNPATALRALNRPEVVKKPGVIIEPISYEEVNPHERSDRGHGRKLTQSKLGNGSGKAMKKGKTKV